MDLIELREYEVDGIVGRHVSTYEIYTCNMVKAITSSANAYWHHQDQWDEILKNPIYKNTQPIETAKFLVTSDDAFVGAWELMEGLNRFFDYYLRAKLIEKVTV